MAGLGKWEIDETMVFAVNTHDVDTGVATDTSGTPSYRIYKNEDGTAITTGSMAKLDDTNTTGFYTELVVLSAANGFTADNVYTIYIEAEVDGVNASMNHFFRTVQPINDLSADAISAVVATAITNYDPPTESEMSASFAALNDLSTAGVSATVQPIINNLNDLSTNDVSATVQTIINPLISDNPNTITKNVQLDNFAFLMVDATNFATPETGLTVSGTISKDGGAFASLSNAVAEIGNGMYKVTMTAAEMNADVVVLRFTASGAADRFVTIVTQPT